MVKFQWTNKILSAINVSTEWSDDVKGRVSEILREFKEAQNYTSTNTSSPKLPSEKLIHIIAMAIIDYTAKSMGVSPSIRQARNDKCDLFAIAKIKELLGKIGR